MTKRIKIPKSLQNGLRFREDLKMDQNSEMTSKRIKIPERSQNGLKFRKDV